MAESQPAPTLDAPHVSSPPQRKIAPGADAYEDDSGYVVAANVSLGEAMDKDADDEALNRWKASLVGGGGGGGGCCCVVLYCLRRPRR
jgi:hypothetical protein